MALSPKSLLTSGLFKSLLDSRGVRLETDGLASATTATELPSAVTYLFGLFHPFIGRLRARIRRSN